jgi:hypothetical protein
VIRIGFWNTKQSHSASLISRFGQDLALDILIVAEQGPSPLDVLAALNDRETAFFYAPGIANTKIHLYTRFDEGLAAPLFETDRLTVRRVQVPDLPEFLLAAVHFPSKREWSDESQAAECYVLADDIRAVEDDVGHRRTVLVGDLNMNPFEDGVVAAKGLHAVNTKGVASRGTRVIQGREYPFFYNPMWGILGDHSPGPPGTYFHQRAEQRVYFWNAFDQVLVRPELISRFDSTSLRVHSEVGGVVLEKASGTPDPLVASDHFPITFALA